jgi:hypothetical protein
MAASSERFPIDARMREWGMRKRPRRLQALVRKVLSELDCAALFFLNDKRLEVRVVPRRWTAIAYNGVWAYFPILPRWTRRARELAASGVALSRPGVAVRYIGGGNLRDRDAIERVFIIGQLLPRPETRVLLVLRFEERFEKIFEDQVRHHLGHVLLFLRDPKARNECDDAENEWRASVRRPSEAQ